MSKISHWLKNQDIIQIVIILSPLYCFFFHLISLEEFSLWFDEITTWEISFNLKYDIGNPPLFYYLVHFLVSMTGSESETTIRLLPAVFGSFIPVTAYFFTKRMFNKNIALVVWSFLLFSPLIIAISREARVYSLLVLVSISSPFILLKLFQERLNSSPWLYLLGFISMQLLAYCHFFGLCLSYFFLLFFLYVYIRSRSHQSRWINISFICFNLLSTLPLLVKLFDRLGTVDSADVWMKSSGIPGSINFLGYIRISPQKNGRFPREIAQNLMYKWFSEICTEKYPP